jgi:hypothetical protein
VREITQKQTQNGYDVIVGDPSGNDTWRTLLAGWQQDPDGPMDEVLEDRMEGASLYAFIYAKPDRHGHLHDTVVFSTRDGAKARRRSTVPAPRTDRPLVLINDHPTKVDPLVAARVQKIIDQHQKRGWTVISPDESLEAQILAGMRGRHDPDALTLSPQVQRLLAERLYGGVLWVGVKPGDTSPAERLHTMRLLIDAEIEAETEGDTGAPLADDWDVAPEGESATVNSSG